MLTLSELRVLRNNLEADFTERTESLRNTDKIGEAICSFANDLPDRRRTGVLFLGLRDDGSCAGTQISDELLRTLLGFRDGRIIPIPSLTVRRENLDGCDVAIVEVQPSEYPPVRYRGRVCVRRGPQRGFATSEEERRLVEKRRAGMLAFDQHGVAGSSLDDLDIALFEREYLPSAVSGQTLSENSRSTADKLAALRFLSRDGTPTVAAILVLGKNARNWIPGAYIQFVRYDGTEITDPIRTQSEIDTPLAEQLRRIDEILAANISTALNTRGDVHVARPDYPLRALQQLVRNAVMHRNYEQTATPVRVMWFSDRIEIISPGGPYGTVTRENFGRPGVTDYRNPTIAEALKTLNFVERFGIGIETARKELAQNGNPALEFAVEDTIIMARVKPRP